MGYTVGIEIPQPFLSFLSTAQMEKTFKAFGFLVSDLIPQYLGLLIWESPELATWLENGFVFSSEQCTIVCSRLLFNAMKMRRQMRERCFLEISCADLHSVVCRAGKGRSLQVSNEVK